jgi:thioredoxin-related protein
MKPKLISFVISAAILMVLLPDTFAFSESIKWYSLADGIAIARLERKNIYINFRADWCIYCKKMEGETFKNPAVISYLNKHFISIRVDTDKEPKLAEMYGVRALPDNWFLFNNGDAIRVTKRIKGYIQTEMFLKILKSIPDDLGAKK